MKKKSTCLMLIIIILMNFLLIGCNSVNSPIDNSLVGTWKLAEDIDHDIQGIYFWDTVVFHADGYGEFHFPYGIVSMELFQWRTDENILYIRYACWHQRLDIAGDDDFADEGRIVWSERENKAGFYISRNLLVIFNDEGRMELFRHE